MKLTHTLLASCLLLLGAAARADNTNTQDSAAAGRGDAWFAEPTPAAASGEGRNQDGAAKSRKPSPRSTPAPQADYAPAQDLLLSAMGLIGVKYKWGGNSPETGLDCSGFVRYVFTKSMNITLPRTAFEMAQRGQSIDKSELKPGDLVFFNTLGRTFSHVGIYLGDNRFIHSPRAGRSVEIVDMNQRYWQQRWNGARRIADGAGDSVNINSLLASSKNERSAAATTAPASERSASSSRQCRKVTTGKGSRKKTTTVCSRASSESSKPAATKAKGKSSGKAKPTSSKKPASSKSTKPAQKKTATKPKSASDKKK
ncbi:C40 family peptidase [Chitinilyticum piscinae]|uniref:C40 family peptidase n=1 Tax=Chitinilyticum piscinae TaxID=2866724 RepID=A0A8J7FSJ3_9NEIS|nr:C40 family peptidase [Chitinilyticum piscinae]MBE9609846.1 C40 family peptidase [Chitinilyticum piscinae]